MKADCQEASDVNTSTDSRNQSSLLALIYVIRNRKFVFKMVFECSVVNLNKPNHHESAKFTMNHNKWGISAPLYFNSERHDSNGLFDNN